MNEQQTTYGIIGQPLKHTLSPVMQNAAFEAMEVPAVYKPFPLDEEEVAGFLQDMRAEDSPIFGLNVTVPYKEIVLPLLDSLSPLAEKIGAVNTVVVSPDRKLVGYNTDAPGFVAHLVELQQNTRDTTIAIMGAGGSARAIVAVLCLLPERPQKIRIYNRTYERAQALIQDLKERLDVDIVEAAQGIDDLQIPESDILINTTSVGLNPDDPLLIEPDLIRPDMLVYDLIYNPLETELLAMAREQGARVSNGLGMLFFQGVLALQHWANCELSEGVKLRMREALEREAGV